MATYQFICSNCGVTKEVVADINEQVPTPYCGVCELDMERKFGLQTIRFIGGGWGKDA
jgi:putative FmdB family regulatory protein